jgi:hypothetical protein
MTMKLIGATGLATIALAGAAFGGAFSPGDALARGGSSTIDDITTGATTTGATTTVRTVEDVSGPCDEAEHRNDPRCTGGAARAERRDDDRGNSGKSGKHRRGKGKGNSGHGRSGRG